MFICGSIHSQIQDERAQFEANGGVAGDSGLAAVVGVGQDLARFQSEPDMRKILCSIAGAVWVVLGLPSGSAAVFQIADGDVPGFKSAINLANLNGQDDTIELAANGNYVLSLPDNNDNGLPIIGADGGRTLLIHGNGAALERSFGKGTPAFRIVQISDGGSVTITGLTIRNGLGQSAGISLGLGLLTLSNCVFSNNSAPEDYGGAILSRGRLNVSDSLFVGNSAGSSGAVSNEEGDAVFTGCTFIGNTGSPAVISSAASNQDCSLVVRSCTFLGNSGEGSIYNYSHNNNLVVEIESSTFSGNTGGAIIFEANRFSIISGTIRNCTFAGNSAFAGACIYSGDGGDFDSYANVTVANCTFRGNIGTYGTAISGHTMPSGGSTQIINSIFDGGGAGTSGTLLEGSRIISLGHNLCSDDGAGFLSGSGDQINTDPKLSLAGLQNNGGATQTIALLADSPAINAADVNAPMRDQRAYVRPGAPDIGAFEYGGRLAPFSAVSRKTHGAAGSLEINLPLTGPAGIECRSGGATNDYQIVFPFATPVSFTSAAVTAGAGQVNGTSGDGTNVLSLNLTGVTNAQRITITLHGLSDGAGMSDFSVPMGVLIGDTNGNGAVTASDIGQTKAQSGQPVTAANFRADVNANNSINASDIGLVKMNAGAVLP